MTGQELAVSGAVVAELALILLTHKAPINWYRPLGWLALLIGIPVWGCLVFSTGALLGESAWRAAGAAGIELYVLGLATWLGWKASKPY
jgi:hypothetical protein